MPVPGVSPLDALKNLASLRESDSPSNLTGLADEFSTRPGASAWEQQTGARNADQAFGAIRDVESPGLRALMDHVSQNRYADESRIADLQSGEPLELASMEGDLHNHERDIAAEGETYPYVMQNYDRDQVARAAQRNDQYVLPSVLKSQSDIATHQIDAQGRVAAANAAHPKKSPLDLLNEAIAYAAGHSTGLTPEQLTRTRGQLGIQ